MFLPTSLDVAKTSVGARVQGPPNLARETLLDHLTTVDPNMGNIITMQTVARLETFLLQIAFWVSLILGGLALLLTRTQEIGNVYSSPDSRSPREHSQLLPTLITAEQSPPPVRKSSGRAAR